MYVRFLCCADASKTVQAVDPESGGVADEEETHNADLLTLTNAYRSSAANVELVKQLEQASTVRPGTYSLALKVKKDSNCLTTTVR